ncbi:MAG TPA: class I SAM-dependent methyltransferase [Lachnospiraceae bacterium]|nr:class I SAM-dependent methyltransferase [Lachnospiraceae bacterium]
MNFYGSISKAYSLLDMIYFSERGSNPREVIKRFIPNREVRILDMCCGTLSNTIDIAKEKPKVEVVGLDLSKDMLKVAKDRVKRNQLNNVKLICTDAANTALPSNSFDYIIIGLVLHESSPTLADGMIKEARRLLKCCFSQ